MSNTSAFFWGIMSRFAPQGIYLITTMILARFLTPNDFGMIGILSMIFIVANTLIDSGLGGSLIHEKDITNKDCSTIGTFNITVGVTIYIILYILAPTIQDFFEIEDLTNVIRTISLVFPITALGVVPCSLLKKRLLFHKIFTSTLVSVIIASIISIICAIHNLGVYSLVIYQIAVNIGIVVLNSAFSKYSPSLYFSFKRLKRLLPFGIWTSIVSISDTIYENLITMLTGKYLNINEAGYLYQAKRLEETMSTSLATSIGIVAFPILTKYKDDIDKFQKESLILLKIILFIFFPLLITISLFSKELLIILFGKKWELSSPYLSVLMICGMFILIDQLMLSFIKSLGRVKRLTFVTIIKRAIGISLLLLSLLYNPQLMIYAYLASTIIASFFNMHLYLTCTNVHWSKLLKILTITFTPSFVYLVLCKSFLFHESLLCNITIAILLLLMYYFFYSRLIGIRYTNFIHLFAVRK